RRPRPPSRCLLACPCRWRHSWRTGLRLKRPQGRRTRHQRLLPRRRSRHRLQGHGHRPPHGASRPTRSPLPDLRRRTPALAL
ncbi:uncharacterized protein METZ01_LOCUS454067, partial [marine metagenome]